MGGAKRGGFTQVLLGFICISIMLIQEAIAFDKANQIVAVVELKAATAATSTTLTTATDSKPVSNQIEISI